MSKKTINDQSPDESESINNDGSKNFTSSNGEDYLIYPFDGLTGRRILLRIVDLIKPSVEQATNPNEIGKALVGGGSESFVNKADKIIRDMMLTVFHRPKNAQGTSDSPAVKKLDDGYCGIHFKKNYSTQVELIFEILFWNNFFDLMSLLPGDIMKTLGGILGQGSTD